MNTIYQRLMIARIQSLEGDIKVENGMDGDRGYQFLTINKILGKVDVVLSNDSANDS